MHGKHTPRVIWERGLDRIVFTRDNFGPGSVYAESSRHNAMGDSVWAPQGSPDEERRMYQTLLIELANKGAV